MLFYDFYVFLCILIERDNIFSGIRFIHKFLTLLLLGNSFEVLLVVDKVKLRDHFS